MPASDDDDADTSSRAVAGGAGEYCTVMRELQFGEMVFSDHHFADRAKSDVPPKCAERLMRELGALVTSLPINKSSSIFVKFDPKR